MKFPVVLAVFLSVAAVASAYLYREACRREWCKRSKIHRTWINNREYCCVDYMHRYMVIEYEPHGLEMIKKCWCKVN
ncbi:hypothetical protein RRG08_051590 [Elysia crispata]|uniref:Uncharacterized protein n=1 Tax=Elysia crispata TaxID=231223 RepID=A0AAE1A368_9GAST|nr:hypothetical protein RRG08_051590 [Elysia crispata]